ncbi:hypothetical protein [Geomicrobium sp. JCM 19055]|uniref:hypothetical protein n=1 Tax=Geomicrobium sp. JCM 19055 TaxID=1460649 RepID=UPI0012678F1E|nr:hypothetical protein [Geomicrobium sp. JCM 19055]
MLFLFFWGTAFVNSLGDLSDALQESKKQPNPKFEHFYTKYGVAGLSLLGTFLLSSQLTATAIVSFEDSKGKATLWVSIAVVILAIVMMLLSIFAAEWLSNLLNL